MKKLDNCNNILTKEDIEYIISILEIDIYRINEIIRKTKEDYSLGSCNNIFDLYKKKYLNFIIIHKLSSMMKGEKMLKEFANTIGEINEIEEEILSDDKISYAEKQFWKTRIEDLKSRFPYDIE